MCSRVRGIGPAAGFELALKQTPIRNSLFSQQVISAVASFAAALARISDGIAIAVVDGFSEQTATAIHEPSFNPTEPYSASFSSQVTPICVRSTIANPRCLILPLLNVIPVKSLALNDISTSPRASRFAPPSKVTTIVRGSGP